MLTFYSFQKLPAHYQIGHASQEINAIRKSCRNELLSTCFFFSNNKMQIEIFYKGEKDGVRNFEEN